MGDRNALTAVAASQSTSLAKLFEDAEAEFPPRFRENRWYLTVVVLLLIGSGQQQLAGRLHEHLVAEPQYQTSAARQALIRCLREAMVKCIIINGIPVVIDAVTSISEVERPEDRDYFCSREDWQIGPETTERNAQPTFSKVLYKSEKDGHVKTLQSHRDIREYNSHFFIPC